MKKILLSLLLFLSTSALAQSVQQSGSITPTHVSCWAANGVIKDCGSASNPFANTFGLIGGPLCINSGPVTGPYNAFCLQADSSGGILSVYSHGGATGGFSFVVNGVAQGFPTVPLPTTVNDPVCFGSTSGKLKDCSGSGTWNGAPIGLVYGGLGGDQSGATAGQVPIYPGSGGAAVPGNISSIAGSVTDAQLPSFGSGDVSCASGGGACTIAANAVTNAKLAQAAANSMKCNNTGSLGAVLDCTVAQIQQMLNGWFNITNSQTSTYPIVSSDCGKTIQAGTGTSGYFTVTLPSVSGFSPTCVVTVKNGDTGRAKLLSGFPTSLPNVRLWPLQALTVGIVNGAWAVLQYPGRWLLPANQTIFVDSSGSGKDDTTVDGLASGSAFHTSPFAYGTVQTNFDLAGQFTVTENQVTNSTTLTAGNTYDGPLTGCKYAKGGALTTACYIINGNGIGTTSITSSTAAVELFFVRAGAAISVKNLAANSSGSGGTVFICATNGFIGFSSVNLGAGGNAHMDVGGPGCTIEADGPWTTSGSVNISAVAEDEGFISLGNVNTISGTPAWTTAYAQADLKGFIEATGYTFSGAGSTGKRVQSISQGTVNTNGGSLNTFFPGSVNGTADAGTFAYFN